MVTSQDSQALYFVMSLCRGGSFWDLIKYAFSVQSMVERCVFRDVAAIQRSYGFTWRKSLPFHPLIIDHRGSRLSPQLCPPNPPRPEAREHSDHGDGSHYALRLRHHHNARQRPNEATQHDVRYDSLPRPGSISAPPLLRSRYKEATSRQPSTSGPSAASPIFSTQAASSSRARTSLFFSPSVT